MCCAKCTLSTPRRSFPPSPAPTRAPAASDRLSSYGDFISLSDVCDVATAKLIAREVSDGVIAPGYEPEALEILGRKRKGNYNVIEIDENYVPAALERKMCFGVTFEQGRNALELNESLLETSSPKTKPCREAKRDLLIALITLKYTQSNSVCYVVGGQTIAWARGSSRAYTAPVWPATRPTSGS